MEGTICDFILCGTSLRNRGYLEGDSARSFCDVLRWNPLARFETLGSVNSIKGLPRQGGTRVADSIGISGIVESVDSTNTGVGVIFEEWRCH